MSNWTVKTVRSSTVAILNFGERVEEELNNAEKDGLKIVYVTQATENGECIILIVCRKN